MGKRYTITICDECPHYSLEETGFGGVEWYQCNKADKEIPPKDMQNDVIPEWCPLEDE
jgi:hypothetical protein